MQNSIKVKIRTKAKRLFLLEMLGNVCHECGKSYRLYDIHHIDSDGKDFNIGNKDLRISSLISEANKCKLLCKNCHRKIHELKRETINPEIKVKMLDHLKSHSCEKCGYSKCLSALEFHHLDNSTKLFNLSDATISLKGMVVGGEITDTVKAELDKCVVLCAQCHSEEHYNFDFDTKYTDEIKYYSTRIKEIQPKIDRALVKSMFEAGVKSIDISRELKASKGTISDILKSFGLTTSLKEIKETAVKVKKEKNEKKIEKSKARLKFNPTLEEAIELKNAMSCREIGALFGVSHVAIYKRLIKMGVLVKKYN